MTTYTLRNDSLFLQNQYIYGSERLGSVNNDTFVTSITLHSDTNRFERMLGEKQYELSNHLGNVLVTITDQKMPVEDGSTGNVDYWNSKVVSYSDYYPFGAQMPGRSGKDMSYRFGFNGMENDTSVYGVGNAIDFGARMYDSRIGRWFSVDPRFENATSLSTYSYAGNIPIILIDPEGETIYIYSQSKKADQKFREQLSTFFGGKVDVSTEGNVLSISQSGELNEKQQYVYNRIHSMVESDDLAEVNLANNIMDDFDSYSAKTADPADFEKLSDDEAVGGLYLHFFEEQWHRQVDLGITEANTMEGFDESHRKALLSEYQVIGKIRVEQRTVEGTNDRVKAWEYIDADGNYAGTLYIGKDKEGNINSTKWEFEDKKKGKYEFESSELKEYADDVRKEIKDEDE